MKSSGLLLIGGGLTALAASLFVAKKKSDATTDAIKDALLRPMAIQPEAPRPPGVAPAPGAGAQPSVAVHATGYWPFSARADELKMEGGVTDRKGKPLYTLEMFQAGKAPYVSVSGDDALWPYGQRIGISAWPGVVFRVVDTGSHFRGVNKVFRVVGEEPLDICVASSSTPVPKKNVTATIYSGDNFAKGAAVVASKFKDQNVVLTGDHARYAAAQALAGAYYDSLVEEEL